MPRISLRASCAISALSLGLITPALAQDATTEEDQIIVTGSPIERELNEVLVGVSLLDGEELAIRQSGTIGETLKAEAGISSSSFGAGASRPIIRGQGGDRIRVLDNGIGSIDASAASPDHAVAAEPAMASRIEVIRGPGLLRYGSSASGGVVNIIDNRMPTEAPDAPLEGSLRIGGSTVDEGRDLALGLNAAASENILLHLSGTYRETDDYDIPGFAESARLRAMEEDEHDHDDDDHDHEEEEEIRDTLENSAVENTSVAAGISFLMDNGLVSFSAKQTDSEYGIPGGHGHHEEEEHGHGDDEILRLDAHEGEEEEEGGVFIVLEQTRYDMQAKFDVDLGLFDRFRLYAGYADYEHTEFEGLGEPGTVFANEGWEARAELIQAERDGWKGAIGLQHRDRDFSAIGEEAFVSPSQTQQTGVYTFQEVELGDWHLEGAARFERTSHENDTLGLSPEFDAFSVSVGTDYHLSEMVRIGGTAFRTERAPTTEELFSDGPHLATDQFELGDPTLDIEVGTGIEVVARIGTERANATINLFQTAYDDYIYGRATGEEEDELPVYQFTAADTTFRGIEVIGDVMLGQLGGFDLSADGALEYVEAELDVEDNDNLPRIPPLGILAGVDLDSDRLGFRAEVDYAAEQDSVTFFELPSDSYTAVNLYGRWQPLADQDMITLRAALLNATDEEVRQHTSFLKDDLPLPGQNLRVSLQVDF